MVRRTVACGTTRSAVGPCVSQQLRFGASGDAPETHHRTTSKPPQMPNRTSGKEIWVACRPSRQRMFHQGRTCQAEPWPQVLAGKGACADCESYYLDFLVHQTVLILAARAKAQRITPAPAARAGNHPGGAHESNSRASHDLAA